MHEQHVALTEECELVPLRVARKQQVARDIWLYELRHPQGGALPEFTPGAHVCLQTPAGFRRNYSLCSDPVRRDIYQIAVKRDAAGRGGSISIVDDVHDGDVLPVGAPNNHFELAPRAARFLFIAGGIGITPNSVNDEVSQECRSQPIHTLLLHTRRRARRIPERSRVRISGAGPVPPRSRQLGAISRSVAGARKAKSRTHILLWSARTDGQRARHVRALAVGKRSL